MSYALKQGQTAVPLLFLLVDSADHISPKTGLTPTVTLSKNGASFASPAGAVTEVGSGWYKVAGNATDSGTLGPLLLHATSAGADPCDIQFEVVAYDPQAASLGLSLAKTTNITGFNDIAATAIVSSGAITTSSGKVSGVALVDTVTTYTGNTPQSGDAFARIGATGSALTSLAPASTALSTANWTNGRAVYLDNLSAGAVALASQIPANFTTSLFASAGVFSTGALANAPAGGGSLNLSQSLSGAIRDLSAVADASLNVGDALVAALCGAAGKESVSGTSYVVKTPSTGTTIRTFTLDSGTDPTSRS